MKRFLTALSILAVSTVLGHASGENWIIKDTKSPVAETVQKLVAAIEMAGSKVFATIDHAAGAKTVGSDLEPMVLVIFGNPKVGTPMLEADRHVGIDLPVRVLVWDEDGKTHIGYEDPQSMKTMYGLDGAEGSLSALSGALEKLTTAAAQ
ncbi:DUF302 domain-containing protein [Mesorhizobium sp. NBSH29]|uniref:DUF302 domain-containing protein n=1 Tax=Mesorhizobium sp. NBSH29 TaxID=2654249 RepID=UPI0018964E41|nr:DUF302 domain-containing protein [Mesorhizobium sp. NBSH29]QPC86897.1 DUF302 domain-containing protein [Mesorhizobium sp. NBSH29]